MKSIAVLIHARTKSTRCPNKHLREFGETTLIDIALSKLGKLKNIEEKYLAVHEEFTCEELLADHATCIKSFRSLFVRQRFIVGNNRISI